MTYKRVLLKLSGEALMGEKPYGIDPAIVQSIAEDVSQVVAKNVQLAIVVGGVLIVVIVIYFPEGLMGWLREKYPQRFGEVIDEKDRKAQVELK